MIYCWTLQLRRRKNTSGATQHILCACRIYNKHCINKLIKIGAPLDIIASNGFYVWAVVAKRREVEMLKSMIKRGIEKDSIDQNGLSALEHVLLTGNIEEIEIQCEQCKEDRLTIDVSRKQEDGDPGLTFVTIT